MPPRFLDGAAGVSERNCKEVKIGWKFLKIQNWELKTSESSMIWKSLTPCAKMFTLCEAKMLLGRRRGRILTCNRPQILPFADIIS